MANDKKAVVAIAKEPTVQESVTKVFDLLGGVTNMIKRGETVILKPNAVMRRSGYSCMYKP